MRARALAATAFALLISCGSYSRPDGSERVDRADGVVSSLRSVRGISPLIDGRPLRREGNGYRVAHPSALVAELDVSLPSSANRAVHLARRDAPGVEVDIVALDVAADSMPTIRGDALVFVDASPGTDVVQLATERHFEELRWVRVPTPDGVVARYRVHLGPGLASVVAHAGPHGDFVEVRDHDGVARLRTAPMFAVDALARRLPLHARITQASAADARSVELTIAIEEAFTAPLAVDPLWETTANMAIARADHGAAVTKDGRVFVVGGTAAPNPDGTKNYLSSAELYDVTKKSWSAAAPLMTTPGASGVATPAVATLADGRILVVGGFGPAPFPGGETDFVGRATRVYDPASNSWTSAASTTIARTAGASLVPLSDGTVLLTGGFTGTARASGAELYAPSTSLWRATAAPAVAHGSGPAVLLGAGPSAGKVLLIGGGSGTTGAAAVELFDPATATWSAAAPLDAGRTGHSAVLLHNGKVLVVGGVGTTGTALTKAELFDPVAKVWSPAGAILDAATDGRAVVLTGGRALVLRGDSFKDTYLFDVATTTWKAGPSLAIAHDDVPVVALPDGRVVVAGGAFSMSRIKDTEILRGTLGDPCTSTEQCATGVCSDSICCESACTGVCEACDEAGKCVPVRGPPKGSGKKCDEQSGEDPCTAKTCDGTSGSTCGANVGNTVKCRVAGCVDDARVDGAFCDGSGTCPKIVATSCGGFRCTDDRRDCRKTCTSSADCSKNFICKMGSCTAATATECVGTTGMLQDGVVVQCAPYSCIGNACAQQCTTSSDCAAGSLCDTSTSKCAAPAAPAETADDSGCALGAPRASLGSVAAMLLLLGVLARRRAGHMPQVGTSK